MHSFPEGVALSSPPSQYQPASHSPVGTALPDPLQYIPGSHCSQSVISSFLVLFRYVPAWQRAGEPTPDAHQAPVGHSSPEMSGSVHNMLHCVTHFMFILQDYLIIN